MNRAEITVDRKYVVGRTYVVGPIDRRIYNSFLEYIGRCIYGC
jgi:alpha-L-arabinofuranosidase